MNPPVQSPLAWVPVKMETGSHDNDCKEERGGCDPLDGVHDGLGEALREFRADAGSISAF